MIGKIRLVTGDITKLQVDAIVNAANNGLWKGDGICGAIHAAAGPGLEEECARLGGCPVGQAKATGSHGLASLGIRRIIHAVGPIFMDGNRGEPDLLRSCYLSSLEIAAKEGLKSIAFPCISTGIFRYPKDQAANIAINGVVGGLAGFPSIDRVVFCCYSMEDTQLYRDVLGGLFPGVTIPG